ncbi:MAG: RIO1 family regulatory kinase/ATPase [Dehalococcoidia bacterium]
MSEEDEAAPSALDEFIAEGQITSVLSIIKTGKEASAYLCRAHPSLGAKFAVAKVYHDRTRRNFANDSVYASGRSIMQAVPGQVGRALKNKSEAGRKFQSALWVDREFETLFTLRDAGLDVPDVYACTGSAVLMEFVGDGSGAALQLQHADLDPADAEAAWARLLWNIEEMLRLDIVHGDLSAYNVLAWKGRTVLIDFPQAVDPRFSDAARDLLERDIRNLGRYFERFGIDPDAARRANDLWWRWKRGRL